MFAKSASAATYYVRADGTVTAANKANATSPNAVGTSLNMAQVKLATFLAGDQILFSSQGGDYTENLVLPSGGSGAGTEIVYANVSAETPVINTTTSPVISTNSKSNVDVTGFSVIYSGASSVANGIVITGNSSSNIAINYSTVNMGGFGYGIISGANSLSSISLDHDSISNVGSSRYTLYFYGTGLSNFSITNHTVAENSNGTRLNNISGLTIDGFSVSGTPSSAASITLNIVSCSGVVTINNVTANISAGGGLLFDSCVFGTGSTISNVSLQNATATAALKVNNSTGNVTMTGATITGTGGTASYSVWIKGSALTDSSLTATISSTAKFGFQIEGSSGITIAESSYSGTLASGFRFDNASNITVSDSSFSGTSAYGFVVLNNSQNISFISDTSNGLGSGGGFYVADSSHVSFTDCVADNGYGFFATTLTGSSTDISYLRCTSGSQSGPGIGSGFAALNAVTAVTYTHCTADYNAQLGFYASNTTSDVTYWYDEASYNGTINNTSDGGSFLPHYTATNINTYYSITHHNFNEGIGDVSTGVNAYYNLVNWANGYALGDIFKGGTVTTPPTVRGNMYFGKASGSDAVKNVISGGGKPRERGDYTPARMTYDYNLYNPLDNNVFLTSDGVSETSWATYHATNETHSQNADPLFVNASGLFSVATDFQLSALSPAIDTGTVTPNITATTVDYAGNPIYGTPDIGAYEYQPPHSLIIATPDTIDIGAGARVYADGKFRDLAATNSAVAHLKVTPSGGSFTAYDATTTRPAYLDITGISSWTNAHKTWIENNAQDAGMVTDHTIGDLNSNKYYTISVTGASASNITGINGTTCSNAVCLSSGDGTLSFRYDGGYSAHTFDMVEDTTAPTNIGLSSLTVNSTSQLTILAQTAADASSGLPAAPYWFTESTSNSGGSSSSDWQTSTTFVDSALSSNTLYTYAVKARDANANESALSSTLSAYTLAAVPTNLAAIAGKTTITLTVDSLPNDTSGSSGYYFSRTGANSGWIQVNSWQDTNLLCGHIYTYSVIYRNGDGTETTPISIDRQTQGCGSSTSGSGSSGGSSGAADTYTLTLNTPTAAEVLTGNDTTIIDYASTGVGTSTVSLFYSLDDGLNWTTLATGLEPTGTYVWTVPNQATGQARLRANVYESAGAILTTTESGDFTIVAVPESESSTSSDQEVGDSLFPIVTSSSSAGDSLIGITADANGHRQAPASTIYGLSPFDGSTELVSTVQAGWLVRSPSYSTVYYVDVNLDRHVFWDAQTYFTWSDTWDDVVWVTDATLPTLTLSSPMLPKPGVVLIKLQSDPAVYKIESDSLTGDHLLRHITSESVAIEMYGSAWADYVLDEDPTMMAHFLRGSAVTDAESVDLTIMKTRAVIAELVR